MVAPMAGDGNKQLITEILSLSEARQWAVAKTEWYLAEVFREDEPETCLCGHTPIIEICILKNRLNGATAQVGNVCVKKFLGLPSDSIFSALRRIAKDDERAANAEAIIHAHGKGWINDWERGFYIDTCRKRNLSDNQLAKRIQINKKLLRNTRRSSKS